MDAPKTVRFVNSWVPQESLLNVLAERGGVVSCPAGLEAIKNGGLVVVRGRGRHSGSQLHPSSP